jgi:hypothetical protein
VPCLVYGKVWQSARLNELKTLPACWMKSGKRDIQVAVKMSADDFAELKRAADVLWAGAILTNSSVILGLAKLKASDVLNPGAAPKKSKPRS